MKAKTKQVHDINFGQEEITHFKGEVPVRKFYIDTRFKFNNPFGVTKSRIYKEYERHPSPVNYEKQCSVVTHNGIAIVSTMKWETNSGNDEFSHFSTVIKGIYYSATLEHQIKEEKQIRMLATRFLKLVTEVKPK